MGAYPKLVRSILFYWGSDRKFSEYFELPYLTYNDLKRLFHADRVQKWGIEVGLSNTNIFNSRRKITFPLLIFHSFICDSRVIGVLLQIR